MTDHSQTSDDTPSVSPETARAAGRAVSALERHGIRVDGVQYNYTTDSFRVITANGDVATASDEFDPQGIGGGNIKE